MNLKVLVATALAARTVAQQFSNLVTQQNGGQCVDVKDWALQNGGQLQLYACAASENQLFRVEGPLLQTSKDMCVDVPSGNAANGASLQVWKCNGANWNQLWTVINGNMIQKTGTNKCIDVRDGKFQNGAVMQLWDCNPGNPNQRLSFKGNSSPSQPPPPQQPPAQSSLLNSQTFSGFWVPSWTDFKNLHRKIYDYNDPIQNAALAFRIPPQILAAVFLQESSANPFVNSAGGFQFTDFNAFYKYSNGKSDRTNIWDSAYAAANYIRSMMDANGGSLDAALNIYCGNYGGYTDSIRRWQYSHVYGGDLKRSLEGKPASGNALDRHRKRIKDKLMSIKF